MDDVEALARALRYEDARGLAMARGDRVRAFELAVEARDAAAMEEVAHAIATRGDAREMDRARAAALRRNDALAEAFVAEASGAADDAIILYERAEAWGRAAKIHLARGETARAGRAFERQVRRDPTDEGARRALARILLEVGKPEGALRAIAELRDDDEIGALRARAHRALGLAEGEAATDRPTANDDGREKLLFGRYEVVREAATTASSRVLEARDRLDPGRARVALKIFTGSGQIGAGRDALSRFKREVEILGRLDVASVLRPRALYDEGPTVVLPWLSGGNVDDLLARGRPSARRAAEIVVRVLDALDAAHRRGIVHRDVKPANVLLDEAGGAYLADFGVAHLGDESATATAGVIGTVRYMAPEQRRGEGATPRSDLYAVGVLLAELLGVGAKPAGLRDLPSDVAALLGELLADDPHERPADAATVRARIGAIAWPDEPLARTPSIPPSLRPAPAEPERFQPREGGRHDGLLDRDELLVPFDDPRAKLAFALAEIADPVLPAVLGVETDALRIERLAGVTATSLSAEERRAVAQALTELHRRGAAHGAVATSLRRAPRGVLLAFPDVRAEGAVQSDLRALEAISVRPDRAGR